MINRDRDFLELKRLKLISLSTEKEVEPIYKSINNCGLPIGALSINDAPQKDKIDSRNTPGLSEPRATESQGTSPASTAKLLEEQKQDIDNLRETLNDLRNDVNSMKGSIDHMKAAFEASAKGPNIKYASEEDLEILADTVSTFNSKISEVDIARLEIKVIKRRLQRLEEDGTLTQSTHTVTGLTQSTQQSSKYTKLAGSIARRPKPVKITSTSSRVVDSVQPLELSRSPELSRGLLQDREAADSNVEMTIESTATDKTDITRRISPSQPRSDRRSTNSETGIKSSHSDVFSRVNSIPAAKQDFGASTPSSLSSTQSSIFMDFAPRSTSPQANRARKEAPSAISLNSHKVIPGSDPEDEDYKPSNPRQPKSPGQIRPDRVRGSARSGRRSVPGLPIPDPEWERPDWDGRAVLSSRSKPPTTPCGTRGRGIIRRGVGGRMAGTATEPKRRRSAAALVDSSLPRRTSRIWSSPDGGSSPPSFAQEGTAAARKAPDPVERELNSEGIPLRKNGLPDQRFVKRPRDEDGVKLNRKGEPDGRSVKRPRDEMGVLIKANGEPDGRSAKARRADIID